MDNTVTLKKITRTGANCKLTISELNQPLLVPEEVIHRYRLVENIVLTPSQLDQLRAEAELLACDQKISRLLAGREHSVGEMRLKLRQKGFGDEAIKVSVTKFRRLGLLDDARYARLVAESSMKRNPSGRAFLVSVLQKKHIARSLAESTADTILNGVDEIDLAVTSLRKRWSLFAQLELERARKKAYNYLSRRGVSYAVAKAAFERLCDENKLK